MLSFCVYGHLPSSYISLKHVTQFSTVQLFMDSRVIQFSDPVHNPAWCKCSLILQLSPLWRKAGVRIKTVLTVCFGPSMFVQEYWLYMKHYQCNLWIIIFSAVIGFCVQTWELWRAPSADFSAPSFITPSSAYVTVTGEPSLIHQWVMKQFFLLSVHLGHELPTIKWTRSRSIEDNKTSCIVLSAVMHIVSLKLFIIQKSE